jgi:hypothetical protein
VNRIVLWALSTLSSLVLLLGYHTSTAGPGPTSAILGSATAGSSAPGSTGSGPGSGAGSTGSGPGSGAGRRTVTGAVASTQWGPVQVQVTLDGGGTITSVQVLQRPSGNGVDDQINSQALPILTRETIDAQSAQIDMVSGATVTSTGYLQSLQSALDQAGV